MSRSQLLEVLDDPHDLSLGIDPDGPNPNNTSSARRFTALPPSPYPESGPASDAMGLGQTMLLGPTAPTAILQDHPVPIKALDARSAVFSAPMEILRVLQKWEGTVQDINGTEFTARFSDLTNPENPPEFMTMPVEEVPTPDRELLAPGAVFYWVIGYRERRDGHRERASSIRFQRLPAWTASARTEAKENAHRLAQELGWT
jgi:hypothetical protein